MRIGKMALCILLLAQLTACANKKYTKSESVFIDDNTYRVSVTVLKRENAILKWKEEATNACLGRTYKIISNDSKINVHRVVGGRASGQSAIVLTNSLPIPVYVPGKKAPVTFIANGDIACNQ